MAANLDSEDGRRRVSGSTFWCAEEPLADTTLVEYGQAIFQPGEVRVPLYLPRDLVDELQDVDFGEDSDSSLAEEAEAAIEAEAEAAVEAAMEAERDSAMAAAQARAEPIRVRRAYLDSLRLEGRRRADSARQVIIRMADSARAE